MIVIFYISHVTLSYFMNEDAYFLTKVVYFLNEVPYFLTKVACSLNEVPYFLTKVACSLNEVPYFLTKVACLPNEASIKKTAVVIPTTAVLEEAQSNTQILKSSITLVINSLSS